MIGVTFLIAIVIGLVIGTPFGIIALVVYFRNIGKSQNSRFAFAFWGIAAVSELAIILFANNRFDCGMQNKNQLGDCFYLYMYWGASFGISLFLGMIALLFKRNKPNEDW